MSTIESAGVLLTPGIAVSPESGLVLPVQPKLVLGNIGNVDPHTYVFKFFKKPDAPQGVVKRGDQFEYKKDEKGKFLFEMVKGEDGKVRKQKIAVLGEDGKPIIKRKRNGDQVCAIEIQRCVKAVQTRENTIASAETALAKAKTPAAQEKAMERLLLARLKRDYTVQRLEKMLAHAKEHNLKTLARHQKEGAEDEKKSVFEAAAARIVHLDKVKSDYILTAQIKAKGSNKDGAFETLRSKYKWIVNKFSRPGATPLESDDAVARGVQGLWDTAMRYDPLRQGENGKQAVFSTVAYNWVMRNTRARTKADVKPGQYKIGKETKYFVSMDGKSGNDDKEGASEFSLVSTESTDTSDSVKMDVADAMASLDGKQQMILKLRYFDGLSVEAISQSLKMPANLVRQLSSEANRLLQERLAAYDR